MSTMFYFTMSVIILGTGFLIGFLTGCLLAAKRNHQNQIHRKKTYDAMVAAFARAETILRWVANAAPIEFSDKAYQFFDGELYRKAMNLNDTSYDYVNKPYTKSGEGTVGTIESVSGGMAGDAGGIGFAQLRSDYQPPGTCPTCGLTTR